MNTFTRTFLSTFTALITLTACDLRDRPSSTSEDITRYLAPTQQLDDRVLARGPIETVGIGERRKSLPRWEMELFARTLLGECGRCSDRETTAIARIILNRHKSGIWGEEIGDVVLFERRGVFAFSTWDPRQNKREAVGPHVDRSKAFARMQRLAALAWQERDTPDPTCGAWNFYHPASMQPRGRIPRWAKGKRTKRIGGAVVIPRGTCRDVVTVSR